MSTDPPKRAIASCHKSFDKHSMIFRRSHKMVLKEDTAGEQYYRTYKITAQILITLCYKNVPIKYSVIQTDY